MQLQVLSEIDSVMFVLNQTGSLSDRSGAHVNESVFTYCHGYIYGHYIQQYVPLISTGGDGRFSFSVFMFPLLTEVSE